MWPQHSNIVFSLKGPKDHSILRVGQDFFVVQLDAKSRSCPDGVATELCDLYLQQYLSNRRSKLAELALDHVQILQSCSDHQHAPPVIPENRFGRGEINASFDQGLA